MHRSSPRFRLHPSLLALTVPVAAALAALVSLDATAGQPTVAPRAVAATASPDAAQALAEHRASIIALQHAPRASRSVRRASLHRTPVHKVARPAWVRPGTGYLSSGYGMRWGRLHAGIDLAAPYGAPIYAAGAGVVTYAGPAGGYGTLVTIRHADGTVTAYGHMSRTLVQEGQQVGAGQVIALVGAGGDATGPHLHFEVRIGGSTVDPIPWLASHGVRI